jgi:hypothetical protein
MKNLIFISIACLLVSCSKKESPKPSIPVTPPVSLTDSFATDMGLIWGHTYRKALYSTNYSSPTSIKNVVFHSDSTITESDTDGTHVVTYAAIYIPVSGLTAGVITHGEALKLVYHDTTYKTMFSIDTLMIGEYISGNICQSGMSALGCYTIDNQHFYKFAP